MGERSSAPYNSLVELTGYLYDAAGRRVVKGSIATMSCDPATSGFQFADSYVLDEAGNELTMFDEGAWQLTNVFGDGELLATYDANGLHFHLKDALGTRRVQTNDAGAPEEDCANLPFGNQASCALVPHPPAGADDATPLHFTGKERDAESGNDYFGARYYGSNMGRFISPDPAGVGYADPSNPQSLNLYSYGYNIPIINIDPSGMECVWDDGSYDASGDPQTGNAMACSGQGGTWIPPNIFEGVEGLLPGSWSGQASSQIQFDWLTPTTTVNAGPWDLNTFLAYGALWADGQLPTQLNYGPTDPATLAMINRPYMQSLLAGYQNAGCPASFPAGQGSGDAYKESARDVASGNPDYIQMEVGGYSGNISTSGGVTTVTIRNISGTSSFFGYSAGVGAVNTTLGTHFNRNALDRSNGLGRNVTQTFTWSEQSPCGY